MWNQVIPTVNTEKSIKADRATARPMMTVLRRLLARDRLAIRRMTP